MQPQAMLAPKYSNYHLKYSLITTRLQDTTSLLRYAVQLRIKTVNNFSVYDRDILIIMVFFSVVLHCVILKIFYVIKIMY